MKLRLIGRHIYKDNKDYFSFSGSGFEFEVIPSKNSFSITLSLKSELREITAQYINIYVNDKFYSKERLVSGDNLVTIKVNLSSKTTIRVIKVNEVYLSTITVNDISIDGGEFGDLPESNKKLIGFFGDSITCGYGVLDYHGVCFSGESEDFSKSYAYLTAVGLDMDYTVVSRSGISLALPIYIDKKFKEYINTVDMISECHETRKLDIAVINLVTNDDGAYNLNTKDEDKPQALETFEKEYISLVDSIIKDNIGVEVVMCYRLLPICDDLIDVIKKVYEKIKTRYSNIIKLVEFTPNSDGANGHPYINGQEEAAKKLIEAIKE
ncbi:MAG: hypothetical protein J5955_06845 [Bacilli bacterium]|nr:hypothetical protein [Bacilli bacterium]